MTTHTYDTHLVWEGTTSAGYRAYRREHRASAPPNGPAISLSADPAFRGDSRLLNPEQLVVMAASSCQLLSFLSVAAQHHVDVVGYLDEARGEMPTDDPPMRITSIVLSPVITVAAGTDVELVHRLVDQAHEECFVANSLRSAVRVDAHVELT
jgi:organic hydroperoxide reductase OsmC/OhrA